MKKGRILILGLCAVSILGLLVFYAHAGGSKDPEMTINLDVTGKAKVTKLLIYHGKWNKQPAVWILAKIKNVTDKPVQYKTRCALHDTGINRGFWVPKVGKPLVKPGKAGMAKYPFPYDTDKMPKKFSITIKDVPME